MGWRSDHLDRRKAALMVVVKMTPRRGGSDQKLT
jgi:hypothetical protein